MSSPPPLIRRLSLAEGLGAAWAAVSALNLLVVFPFVFRPYLLQQAGVAAIRNATGALASHVVFAPSIGALGLSLLVFALFRPMNQMIARTLMLASLVLSLATSFFISATWTQTLQEIGILP